jgi:hypothetical protein
VHLAVGQWPDVWRDRMGGRTGRSGGGGWPKGCSGQMEGEGRARRGRREGPDRGGWGGSRRVWEVAKQERRVSEGKGIGTLPDKGGCLMGWGGSAGRGFVGAGRDGGVSEREGRRGW